MKRYIYLQYNYDNYLYYIGKMLYWKTIFYFSRLQRDSIIDDYCPVVIPLGRRMLDRIRLVGPRLRWRMHTVMIYGHTDDACMAVDYGQYCTSTQPCSTVAWLVIYWWPCMMTPAAVRCSLRSLLVPYMSDREEL